LDVHLTTDPECAVTTVVADDIGTRLSEHLVRSLGEQRYERWFVDVRMDLDPSTGRLQVTAPNRFTADLISRHCRAALGRAATEQVGREVVVTIDAPAPSAARRPAPPPPTSRSDPRRAGRRPTSLRHRLDEFVVGPSNRLAFNAALRLAQDGDAAFNPLVVHGGCGVGKTHLLQGLCRRFNTAFPDKRWRYLTAEQFTNQYISAIQRRRLNDFRSEMRGSDLLVVDDVQFLANKTGTQAEFLHTFDALELNGAKMVMACDVHPRRMGRFSEALVSRFLSGMVAQIAAPDDQMRCELIAALGRRRGLVLRDEVLGVLAGHARGSVREIEGMVNLLSALADAERHHPAGDSVVVGRALVDRLLGASGMMRPARPIRFATILQQTCEYLNVDRAAVLSGRRHKRIVLARSLIAYLAREMTSLSFPELAHELHRPSHTTVITACQRVQSQVAEAHPVHIPAQNVCRPIGQVIDELRRHILAAAR
jgi:chromosomal replication initiator protein